MSKFLNAEVRERNINMKNNMNIVGLMKSALAQLKLNKVSIYDVNIENMGEELYISFVTDWQYYELICSGSGKILGINTEPRSLSDNAVIFMSCSATA